MARQCSSEAGHLRWKSSHCGASRRTGKAGGKVNLAAFLSVPGLGTVA